MVIAWVGGHPLGGGHVGGRDEGLSHAHGHGDDVRQGKQGLRVGGPHVGMLRGGRGHGDTIAAAGALGLAERTGGRGGKGGECGVTGYASEERVDARGGGTGSGRVLEREVTVAHEGQVVVLVVRQETRRVVVVVVIRLGRPWKKEILKNALFSCLLAKNA